MVVAPFNEQQPDVFAQRLISRAVKQVYLFSRDVVSKACFASWYPSMVDDI